MAKRVLVVENYANTSLGQVGDALAESAAAVDLRRPYLGEVLPPTAADHDAVVVLGGGQNALADDAHPYFPALLDLIRDFESRDRSVLGICLGSQLIARAFGGTNQIGGAREFGWCGVDLTEAARNDAVLDVAPNRFPIFQWHDDTFSLPARAVHLAGSDVARNQAFRIGRATYGIQFHFEANTRVVRDWSEVFAGWIAEREPDWATRHPVDARSYGREADAAGLAIARAWVATI